MTLLSTTVYQYDHTGNHRVPAQVTVGDEIEWKRQGSYGFFRCRVLALGTDAIGNPRLRLELLSHDGRPVTGKPRWINGCGVMRVYPQ